MRIYLRTRGRARDRDYRFLGEAPGDFWWRTYGNVTDVERPTILVESDGGAWRIYIAGIGSTRLDSTDSAIQYNLALAGDCAGADPATRQLAHRIVGFSAGSPPPGPARPCRPDRRADQSARRYRPSLEHAVRGIEMTMVAAKGGMGGS